MASQFRLPFSRARRSTTSSLDRYMVLVALAGLGVCTVMLPHALSDLADVDLSFWVLAACVLPAEVIRIPVWRRGVVNQITMSRPFALALLIGWGAPLTIVVFVLASIASDVIYRKPALRIAFNAGQYALSIGAAGAVYQALGGRPALTLGQVPVFIAAAVTLMLVNRLLVRVAVALYEHKTITISYLLLEAQVELVEGAVQFSIVLVALLIANHQLVLPAVLALPVVTIILAGRAAERAEGLSRDYAEQALRYRHLFVVADRFRRQADAGGAINHVQLAAVALELRASTSMLGGLLGTIASEAQRRQLDWLGELAGNGVEHAKLLAGKLEQLGQAGPPPRATAGHELTDATDLVRVAEQLARTICQGRPVVAAAPQEKLPVRVNQDEVLDVLGNLVLNAHRFAPPSSPIHLLAEVHAGQVVLAVEDDGVQVTPERREQVFAEQAGHGSGLGGGGLAHGLAMARQLAHANGGELRAVDPQLAGGKARFELSLPLQPASALGGASEPEGPPGAARPETWRLFGSERPHAHAEPRDPAPTKR